MNWEEVLSASAGLAGIHWMLNDPSSRRALRREAQRMLQPGYRAGRFRLTRAKFKPDRNLLAYFSFPALGDEDQKSYPLHLAVAWQRDLNGGAHPDGWTQLQEEANRSGLMPVQCALWRDLSERGLRLRFWPFDPEFPQLIRLGDPSYVAGMFASLGITDNPKQLPAVTPIRYRPGERHVLRYEINPAKTRPGDGRRLYAKLYSNAQDAVRAFGVANRVIDWLDANPQGLQGVRPAAMSPEDCVILYPHAPGIPLSHQLHRAGRWLGMQLQTIGRGLALLHRGPETLQARLKQNTFANEAKVVRRASEHIQALLPETHAKILEIVERSQERYADLPRENPTFTHSDFKSDHLLTTPQGLTLIDFDTCTLTDPALDIGKFLADLDWWFTVRWISGLEEAQVELIKGYLGNHQSDQALQDRLRRARLFHALILTKIVIRRVPIYKKDWAEMTGRIVQRAAQVLHNTITI